MKEEVEIRKTDSRVTLLGQKTVGTMVESGICLLVEKGVLGSDNLVEL